MTPWQRLKVFCRSICVLLMGELIASARTVRGYWWIYLSMAVAILSWVGWMHERADKLDQLAAMQEDWREYRERSSLIKGRILDDVRHNKATLQDLTESQRQGPRHTACDTKQILADLRARGVDLPRYEVEERCR